MRELLDGVSEEEGVMGIGMGQLIEENQVCCKRMGD